MAYHFDQNLRDVPDSPDDMAAAIDFLSARLDVTGRDHRVRMRILGLLGVYCRMLGRLAAAEAHLDSAVTLCIQLGDVAATVIQQIRLAHVYHWQRRYTLSDRLFAALIEQCEHDPAVERYRSFAYQHYGKSLFDQGRYAEAQQFFKQALEIRAASGDHELIESSRTALETARLRLQQPAGAPTKEDRR